MERDMTFNPQGPPSASQQAWQQASTGMNRGANAQGGASVMGGTRDGYMLASRPQPMQQAWGGPPMPQAQAMPTAGGNAAGSWQQSQGRYMGPRQTNGPQAPARGLYRPPLNIPGNRAPQRPMPQQARGPAVMPQQARPAVMPQQPDFRSMIRAYGGGF